MATGAYLLLSLLAGTCVALNLDTAFPLLKTGTDESLFGLSVALHKDLKTNSYLLLVGAPREKAAPNVPANRTGGVYSCPITVGQSDCSRMNLINPDHLLDEDVVEDMWLGVSVASQGPPGGRVLACGHRFVKLYGSFKLYHMVGQCFIRGNDLQFNEEDMHWQRPEQLCSHLGDIRGQVMCTSGMSASITQTEVIVGSPGSHEWQGNVHVSWMNPHELFDTRRNSFPNMKQRNIYIGYSVTQAPRLLSKDKETIVTGAPKDNKNDARGSVLLVTKQSDQLIVQQTLRGELVGSYFGNVVATSDLNNDGWNDLLVGAPFYFEQQQGVGGAVYVYMNTGGRFDSSPSVVLKGPVGSAFGMAVCAAGDLNQDGFQDFAVGAPFHETGSVMIWTGSKEGVSTKPSQVIQGSKISPQFRTFGYSLNGGVDVDGNKYPDLLVGSLDDTVALLRSRPVVHLGKNLTVAPYKVDPNSCDYCIKVEVCFSYMFSTGERSRSDNITVQFTLTADTTSLKSRLRFRDGQSEYSGYMSLPKKECETVEVGLRSRTIRDKVEPLVFSLNVSLYEKLPKKRKAMQDLKQFPVLSQMPEPIRTEIHFLKACGSDNRCHSNLLMSAQFTDENQKPFPTSGIEGQEDKQMWFYDGSASRLFLEVNVSNTPSPGRPAEDAHNTVLRISIPRFLTYSAVRTKNDVQDVVQCSVDDTLYYVLCDLGNPLKSNHRVQVLIIFQPSEVSLDTRVIESELKLTTLSEQSDLFPLHISMLVDYSLQTSLTLINPPGFISFSGEVVGESAMKTAKDVGSLVIFTLQVHIIGKPLGQLGALGVEFDWPLEVPSGKWLLYLTEIQMNGTSQSHCTPPGGIINPLNLKLSKEEEKSRRRRSLEETVKDKKESKGEKTLPVLHLQGKKRKSYSLGCAHGAKCVKFVCPLVNMNNTATLTIRARLWNSTMIEDYNDARTVTVRGKATLKLQTSKPSISMDSQSTEIEVDVYPDQGLELDSGAPLWIIVVSILAGVLLLALICLLLWKCGFFERQRTWRATVLHQGRIMDKDKQQQYTDADGFLIQDKVSSSRGRKSPKHWVTSWTETN